MWAEVASEDGLWCNRRERRFLCPGGGPNRERYSVWLPPGPRIPGSCFTCVCLLDFKALEQQNKDNLVYIVVYMNWSLYIGKYSYQFSFLNLPSMFAVRGSNLEKPCVKLWNFEENLCFEGQKKIKMYFFAIW